MKISIFNVNNLMINYIEAIKTKLIGERDIELADLETLIMLRAGIGDHADIGKDMEQKIANIESLDSKIETINRYFTQEESAQ